MVNSSLVKVFLRWAKSKYIIAKVKRTGIYIQLNRPVVESRFMPIFYGYFIYKRDEEIKVKVSIDNEKIPVSIIKDNDLETRYQNMGSGIFQILLDPQNLPIDKELIIEFVSDSETLTYNTGWSLSYEDKTQFMEAKKEKIEKLQSILICPKCGKKLTSALNNEVECSDCSTHFPWQNGKYNFLSEEFKRQAFVVETTNISANEYDHKAREIIAKFKDGLILDNGAGLRGTYYTNVINFEISDYPTTDVMGIGEVLPFEDNAFDAAFTLNVMEHVKNPFEYAKEIKRVVKKGGVIYAAVPFLQPFHGFPNHFYNMTSEGLRVLFEDMDIVDSGVVSMGHPIFSLSWMLDEYLKGLPPKEQRRFSKLRVKDLVKPPHLQIEKSYAKKLSVSAQNVIASVNYVICTKL